ncbi:MAG: TonB-dependent receptor, partial [Psychrobium sp.]|nr:TonB-dependent receptor [Psychrobium sp.]
YKLSVLPQYQMDLQHDQQLSFRLGATFDDTNRDDSQVSLIGDITWNRINADDSADTFYLSYAQASQVAGYTAIGGSDKGGLFRSNYNLGRETTKNIELGLALDRETWRLDSAIFYRQDDDLTDWTYNLSSTTARSANPVDIDTLGLEILAIKRFENVEIVTSYTFLKKSEDYGAADIDASFYALNYPDHRVTLGLVWRPSDIVEIRVDNEWRKQQENILRNGDDDALFTHLTFTISPSQFKGLDIMIAADNLWDESFEEIPGTPGRGQQYTISATYHW